jgi:hypothetical protein
VKRVSRGLEIVAEAFTALAKETTTKAIRLINSEADIDTSQMGTVNYFRILYDSEITAVDKVHRLELFYYSRSQTDINSFSEAIDECVNHARIPVSVGGTSYGETRGIFFKWYQIDVRSAK